MQYKLGIKQCEHCVLGKWYEYELTDVNTQELVQKDSIDDVGQGMEKATEQVHTILKRRNIFK